MHCATAAPALSTRGERSDAAGVLDSARVDGLATAPTTGSPMICFDTLGVVASIGAFVPVLFGKETADELETVSEGLPKLA